MKNCLTLNDANLIGFAFELVRHTHPNHSIQNRLRARRVFAMLSRCCMKAGSNRETLTITLGQVQTLN